MALLLVIVALSSRPAATGGTAALDGDVLELFFDVTTYLLAVMALLSLALLVWALWPRRDDEPLALPRRRRSALATVVTTALAIAALLWLRGHRLGRLPGQVPSLPAPAPPPAPAVRGGHVLASGVDWAAVAIVAALVALAAVLAWRALRGGPRHSRPPLLAGVEALLDDAIDDVLNEADPRRAVIRAWARLERLLARSGLPRRPHEAPFEYAARARAALDVEAVPLERLAGLFEWARFSLNEVTTTMREEALAGLLAARDGLRDAA